jgi:hypothetical protein
MQAPRKEDGGERRPRLSGVISELRLRESNMGPERRRRLPPTHSNSTSAWSRSTSRRLRRPGAWDGS